MGEKERIIQLHQLFAQVQQFLTHECDLQADSDTLSEYHQSSNDAVRNNTEQSQTTYKEIGVDALDINAPTKKKKNAMMTLVNELTTLITAAPINAGTPPSEPTTTDQPQTTQTAQIHNLENGDRENFRIDTFATADSHTEDIAEQTEPEKVVPGFNETNNDTTDPELENAKLTDWMEKNNTEKLPESQTSNQEENIAGDTENDGEKVTNMPAT